MTTRAEFMRLVFDHEEAAHDLGATMVGPTPAGAGTAVERVTLARRAVVRAFDESVGLLTDAADHRPPNAERPGSAEQRTEP